MPQTVEKPQFWLTCRLNRQANLSTGKVKGALSLAKRPLLKNSPPGCFVNSPLVNAPFRQGVSLTAVSDQRLCLWIPPAFLKNCWTKKLLVQKSLKDFFDKLMDFCILKTSVLYENAINKHQTIEFNELYWVHLSTKRELAWQR